MLDAAVAGGDRVYVGCSIHAVYRQSICNVCGKEPRTPWKDEALGFGILLVKGQGGREEDSDYASTNIRDACRSIDQSITKATGYKVEKVDGISGIERWLMKGLCERSSII